MFTVLEIHTGKLGIFLLALLFRAALLLDFWNFPTGTTIRGGTSIRDRRVLLGRKLPGRDGNFLAPDFTVDPANWRTRLLKCRVC